VAQIDDAGNTNPPDAWCNASAKKLHQRDKWCPAWIASRLVMPIVVISDPKPPANLKAKTNGNVIED
jgi:hypothetical protein